MNEVLNKFIERLTSNYGTKSTNNVHKLMQLTAEHIQENEDTLKKIAAWNDIDQAKGKVLDRIGSDLQQDRGLLPDETFRILIKSKMKRSLSSGSIDTLIDFLSFVLQIPAKSVEIRELWPEGKNASLYINVPADAVTPTGLSLRQFGELINLVVAAGVRAEVLFEGTFSFSSDYENSEFDNAAGFADDEQTIGGTMGYVYDPSKNIDLPI